MAIDETSWLDRSLGLEVTPEEIERARRCASLDDVLGWPEDPNAGRAIALSDEAEPPQNKAASRPPADDVTVGNSVYNETSGLRPTANRGPGSAEDLSNARVAMARVTKNRHAAGHDVGSGTAPGQLKAKESTAVKTYPPSKSAYADSQAAAAKSSGDKSGPQQFYLDYGNGLPYWAQGKQAQESYGPFGNPAGGGDVPRNRRVFIRIYK